MAWGMDSNGPGGGSPPPPDEAWWDHVLKEEEGSWEPDREGQRGSPRKPAEAWGSAEDWSWAGELYARDDTVELPVVGFNRGGLLVEARSLRGFVPISHLIDFSGEAEVHDEMLSDFIGRELCLKVIEHDPLRGRLVLSQRAALAGPGERLRILASLQPGDIVTGSVTNITRFGVFVDLGGLEGLIHVSELSWGRVRHPADVVHCGKQLQVKVLSLDRDQCRVALSLKDLLPDPWVDVAERYRVGDVVEGTVTNVVGFGAFVGLDEGLEGLIHVSELGEGNMLHPRNVVEEGEHVRARIIHLNPGERRLGLSLRQVAQVCEENGSEGHRSIS